MKNNTSIKRTDQRSPREAKEFEAKVEKRLMELEIQQDIVALREEAGLTQTELAKIAGVNQPFIAKLESGRALNLELKTLVRTATALGAEVEIRIIKKPTQQNGAQAGPRAKKSKPLVAAAANR